MTVGEVRVAVELSDEFRAQLEAACRRMEAAAAKGAAPAPEPIGAALLGAAAAAVLPPKPVSRRRLLFPWREC